MEESNSLKLFPVIRVLWATVYVCTCIGTRRVSQERSKNWNMEGIITIIIIIISSSSSSNIYYR